MPIRLIKKTSDIPMQAKRISAGFAFISFFLGFLQLIGWSMKSREIITLWHGKALMSFNTSICMMIAAIGMVALLSPHHFKNSSLPIGIALFAAALASWLHGAFGIGGSFDQLMIRVTEDLGLNSITSVYTSSAFILISVAIILHSLSWAGRVPIQTGVISSAVAAIGAAGVILRLLEMIPDSGASGLGALALSTASGILFLGCSLVVIEIKRYPLEDRSWVSAMVGTLGFVLVMIIWHALRALPGVGHSIAAFFLISGTLLALLASFSTYFALVAKRSLDLVLAKEKQLVELNTALEAKVNERTRELANSNAELERFASMAAHDLKSPVNSMMQFAELLNDDLGPRLTPDEKELLTYIIRAGKRARAMIDSLLEFAKSGSRSYNFEKMDANVVAWSALENLNFDVVAARAKIEIEPLPTVCGDRIQITQLFQNLLANAIKFRKPDQSPMISIKAQEEKSTWHFCVADNGIGIDPKDAKKVFEFFSRLHSQEEYEGTGLGLAMCRRIIDNHQGRIWIESEPGRGTAFHFTLPKIGMPESQC